MAAIDLRQIELRTGDALQVLAALPAASVDLVIADPPYNLKKDYGNQSDHREFDDYLAFSRAWLTECRRVMKPDATLYVFMGVRFISYLYDILERDLGLRFNSWICWHYTQGLGKTRGFSPRHDDILMFTASGEYTFNLDDVRVPQKYYRERNNMRGANPGDVWAFSHVHYSHPNRQPHPTQKPEGLIERMVRASSDPGALVLDPFSGSGTVPRVCQQLDRRCLAVELNPDYAAAIVQRLAQPFTGFDSVDPRMERVPLDLRRPELRESYLADHERWFLDKHDSAVGKFRREVKRVYGED